MGNGRNHNFVIQTRQKADQLFSLSADAGAIAASGTVAFPIRRVAGYGAIRFLAVSTSSLRLRVEQAPAAAGPWVETVRVPSVASPSGDGQQVIDASITPSSSFMRVFLDNIGGSDATADLSGLGIPIAGGGDGGGGGGGGGGCCLGTTITNEPDTAVGVGATVPLPTPPLGTLRMTVEVTGGDSDTRIRVRALGGAAGEGRLLILLGSTMYGGDGGAIAPLEVENVAGPAAAVMIDFEGP